MSGQSYNLNVVNGSNREWTFYVYQKSPDLAEENVFTLAWLVSPYKVRVGDHIKFTWSIDYQFVWSDVGKLEPGIVFDAGGPKACNPEGKNTTHFTVPHGGGPGLSEAFKAYDEGTLYIKDGFNVPSDKFSVGIGMKGAGTIVKQAGPNLTHKFTPTPTYWVAAGNEMQIGTVLDVQTVTKTKEVVFPDNVYEITATLTKENEWKIAGQADAMMMQAMTADANSVGSIAATTPNAHTTNNYNICALV